VTKFFVKFHLAQAANQTACHIRALVLGNGHDCRALCFFQRKSDPVWKREPHLQIALDNCFRDLFPLRLQKALDDSWLCRK
jgi:hypothetical protein